MNGTVNSVASGSVSGLVHSPVEVQVPFHGLSMGSFQPLAIKLSFTGRGTVLFRPSERPREGFPVNGPVNDPVGGLLSKTYHFLRILVKKGSQNGPVDV